MSDVRVTKRFANLLPKKEGVHWLTLVLTIVVSVVGCASTTSFMLGQFSQKIDQVLSVNAEYRQTISHQIDTLNQTSNNLAISISALTAEIGGLREALNAERQERLDEEARHASR